MKSLQSPEMGAKLSKKGSKDAKAKEDIAEPALTTFDKTATLPASFRKRNVNQESTVSNQIKRYLKGTVHQLNMLLSYAQFVVIRGVVSFILVTVV